jgi:hypothetical protein
MKKKVLAVLKWTAIVVGGLYFLLWVFYGEHESYPHAALTLFIFAFWWEMNQKLNRLIDLVHEAKQLVRYGPSPLE